MSNDTEAAGLRRSTAHQFAVSKVEIFRAKKTCQYTALFDIHNCSSETGPNTLNFPAAQSRLPADAAKNSTCGTDTGTAASGRVGQSIYETRIARELADL